MTQYEHRTQRFASILIFLVTLLSYAWFFPRWADQNVNSRLNMVRAIVEDRSFQIDKYVNAPESKTVDYATVDGHFYSDKAPGIALLGVPIYAVLDLTLDLPFTKSLTERLEKSDTFKGTLRTDGSGVSTDKVRIALAQVVLSFLLGAIPTAALCVLLFRLLIRMTGNFGAAAAAALIYGICTPAFAYANTMYGHQLSAFAVFAAFYMLFQQRDGDGMGFLRAGIVGLLLGYSVLIEYPAVLIAGLIYVYAVYVMVRTRGWVNLAVITLMLALCAGALMYYNNALFGGPFKLGYQSSTLWTEQHSTGFLSLGAPKLSAIWGITFSPFRGLFVLSPVLLLTVFGFWLWWQGGEGRFALVIVVLAAVALFVFTVSSAMWWGGWSVGPRYFLPALPFLAIGLGFALEQPVWKALAVPLVLLSLGATWSLTLAEQAFPPDTIVNPLRDFAWPALAQDNIARNVGNVFGLRGKLALLPLAGGMGVLLLTLWIALATRRER